MMNVIPIQKIVMIDWSILLFRSIFIYQKAEKKFPCPFIALRMLFKTLKHINVYPDDIIILAIDSYKGSWRRDIDSNYKADRKAKREATDIDWNKHFNDFNRVKENLKISSPFHIVEVERCEADDIISYIARHTEQEVIIVSTDSDYQQLLALKNVKLISPFKEEYTHIEDPYSILHKKIIKEETDNLTDEIYDETDYEKRLSIVSLLELPKEIEDKIKIEVEKIDINKTYDLNLFPYSSLQKSFLDIYSNKIPKKEVSFIQGTLRNMKGKSKVRKEQQTETLF